MSAPGKHIHLLEVVVPRYQELHGAKQSVMPIVKEKGHGLKMFCLITKDETAKMWNLP